jgi:hypothetical protein
LLTTPTTSHVPFGTQELHENRYNFTQKKSKIKKPAV